MDINSIKTKDSFHNYVTIKQSDNTSPIEVLLCDSKGALLSNLNEKCTVSIYDAISREVRQVSDEQIVDGVLSFKIVNDLLPYTHKLEVTTFSGVKFPADDDFQIFVSESHNSKLINIIKSIPTELALKVVTQQVMNRFNSISDNFVNYIKKGEVTVNDLDVREKKITKEYISDDLINSIQSSEALSKENQSKFTSYVKKGEVIVGDIDKNKGLLDATFFSSTFLSQLKEGTINATNVLDLSLTTQKFAEKSVTPNKTSFLVTGKNILNTLTKSSSKLVSYTTGALTDNAGYNSTDYLPVLPNATFTQNYSYPIAYFDASRKYVGGLAMGNPYASPRTFTVPQNAVYIITSYFKETEGNYQIELGSTVTNYEKFKYDIDGLVVKIPENSITSNELAPKSVGIEELSFLSESTNLFNKSKVKSGYYVIPSTGKLQANQAYSTQESITIKPNTKYTKSDTSNLYAWSDSNNNFIYTSTESASTITSPANARYLTISVSNSNINNYMLVEGITLPSTFMQYESPRIPQNLLPEIEKSDVYGKWNLKRYVADVAKMLNTRTPFVLELTFIGDSWVQGGEYRQGDRLTLPLRSKMTSIYGDAGIGFVGFHDLHLGAGILNVTKIGNWVQRDQTVDASGLDIAEVESTTAGDSIKVEFFEELNYYEIHTQAGNTGTWRYSIDGGNWTTVDASQEVTVINMSLGKHTINIEHVSGTTTFIGGYAYKGEKGVVINKVGNGGATAKQYIDVNRQNYVNQLKRSKSNTFGILLGTNDHAQNIAITDFKVYIKELISRIKEAKPQASIILIAPSGNNLTGRKHTIDEYADALLEVAKELSTGYVNLYKALGDFATTNENGLMQSDGVHPNENGGIAIANVIYDGLLRI